MTAIPFILIEHASFWLRTAFKVVSMLNDERKDATDVVDLDLPALRERGDPG